MKIAYVYDAVYPYIKGGAEKRIYETGRRLAERGHEVHWYGIKWWDGVDVIQQDGIYLHGVCKSRGLYTEEGRRSIKEAVRFAARVIKPISKEKFDVIDVGNFPYLPAFSCKFVSKIRKTPLVVTWHEVWGDYWYEYLGVKGFFGKIAEKITSKLPDRHIAVSEHTKKELVTLGVRDEKITMIPNGIDFDAIQKIPSSAGGCDVLFVGRLIKEKNVDVLIKTVAEIKKNMSQIKCSIIGEGPERETLMRLSEKLGLGDNVRFLGPLDYEEVIATMKSSRVLVLPSTREGFGIVLLEAMASQTPVIAVRAEKSAASEIVNGKNGILCGLGELGKNIIEVLTNEKLRRSMIEKGLEYSKQFDWDNIEDSVSKFYSICNKDML